MDFDATRISVGLTQQVTFTAAITTITYTIPLTTAGTTPQFVRVLPEANAYLAFGPSGVSVTTANGALITPNQSEVFAVKGQSYFAVIAKVATVVSVVPVDI